MEKDLNFGVIKYNLMRKLSETTDKDQFISLKEKYINFINDVKSSPLLTLEFFIFKNIENKNIVNESSALRYIDENINLIKNINYNDLIKENGKIKKYYINTNIPESKVKLYESIQNIIIEKTKDLPDIDLLHESIEYILDEIKKPKTDLNESVSLFDDVKNDFDYEYIIEKAVEKFNKKYSHLNENEKKLIKVLIEEDESKMIDLMTKTKKEIQDILDEQKTDQIDSETSTMINETIDKVESMVYNKESFVNDMVKLFELKNELS